MTLCSILYLKCIHFLSDNYLKLFIYLQFKFNLTRPYLDFLNLTNRILDVPSQNSLPRMPHWSLRKASILLKSLNPLAFGNSECCKQPLSFEPLIDHISILVHYEDFLGTVRLVRDGDFGCYFKNKFLPF